jgi:hypothetical protein
VETNTATENAIRECPFCKEEIKAEAVKCKYCQSGITPEKPAHQGICPFCKEEIKPDATRCRHCRSDLSPAATREQCHCEGTGTVSVAQRPRALPPTFCDASGTMWCLGDCATNGCFYFKCGSCASDFGRFDLGVSQQRRVDFSPMTSGAYNSGVARRPQVSRAPTGRICDADGTYWCATFCGPDYCFYEPCGSCIPSVGGFADVFSR